MWDTNPEGGGRRIDPIRQIDRADICDKSKDLVSRGLWDCGLVSPRYVMKCRSSE